MKSLDIVKSGFHKGMSRAQEEKGEKRSAGSNAQGHQFTPSMIHALLMEAASSSGTKSSPKGGFTDCGIHTGGHPRNTSFPLVRSYFHWMLKRSDDVESTTFLKTMIFFDLLIVQVGLKLLQKRMPGEVDWECQSHGLIRQELDSAMAILTEASLKSRKLFELQVDLRSMLDRATRCESTIKEFQSRLQDHEVASYTFGDIESELSAPGAFRNPKISLDPTSPWSLPIQAQDDVDALTKKRIGLVPLFGPAAGFDWPTLLVWAKARKADAMLQIDSAWLLTRYVSCSRKSATTIDGVTNVLS